MVKKIRTVPIERTKAKNFASVARNFLNGAEVASEYEYWNAAGVLIVHSAIAYSDAITIKYGKVKSRSDDHQDVISLVDNVVAEREGKKEALSRLSSIISHKNYVSYSGELYTRKDIEKLMKSLKRYVFWAEEILKN